MPNIVAISKDPKVRQDLERLCSELAIEDLHFASFDSQQSFESLYFHAKEDSLPTTLEELAPTTATGDISNSTSAEGVEATDTPVDLRLFSSVNIILVCEDALTESIHTFAPKVLKNTKLHGMWPQENRTRVLFLKFEEDHFDKTLYTIPTIEDFIFLPLDRLLFLQKMEIYLNLPKTIKPTYLFTQQIDTSIEISKIVVLDKLTDCALAIRNKTALKPGVRGKFYLAPPGQKNRIRFFGKVFKNEPHPDYPGEYLVYFFFFGVRKAEVSVIRRWLGSDPKYHSLVSEDSKKFTFNADDMFLTAEDKATQSVALIDFDDEHAKNISDFLERKIGRLSISTHSSFSIFYENALTVKAEESTFSPIASAVDDLPKGGLRLSFNRETKALTQCIPNPQPETLFCGHPMDPTFKVGEKTWYGLFDLQQNQLIFDEALTFLNEQKPYKRLIFAKNASGEWMGFMVDFSLNNTDLVLTFNPASTELLLEKIPTFSTLSRIDALIIDTVFVPRENFNGWLDGLLEKVQSNKLIKDKADLKIILISDKEDRLDEAWLKRDNVVAMLLKPADQKSLAVMLSVILKNQNTVYNFENLGWIKPGLKTHLSKPVQMVQISEFGATIDTSTPFQEGSYFYFRKAIFDEAPNGCLAGRVYKTEVHPSEPGRFLCHASYYGITDTFLKHARTYMRELYSQSKSKG